LKFIEYLERKILKDDFNIKLQYSNTLGTDGISTNKFSKILDEEIDLIEKKVKDRTYNISPYKEQLILKSRNSNPRMISIPTNRDKLVLNALQKFIAAKFKDIVSNDNVSEKINTVKKIIQSKKYNSFIKIDIKNFYPNIDHQILLEKIKKYIDDEEALYILEKALTQITIAQGRRVDKNNNIEKKGVAQGLSISNILASIYLHDVDVKYQNYKDMSYFRYVDDILIICDKEDVENIKICLKSDIEELNLELHEFKDSSDKSTSGTINVDDFQFLGFRFHKNIISVREQSIDKLRNRIVEVFYSNIKNNDEDLYKELNLKISGCVYDNKHYGWMHFFRQIDDQTLLYSLDSFVKSQFIRFNRKYDEKNIKKFIKTYFLLKDYDINKLDNTTYIKKFDTSISKKVKRLVLSVKDDVEFY